jgi:hypothetical protein
LDIACLADGSHGVERIGAQIGRGVDKYLPLQGSTGGHDLYPVRPGRQDGIVRGLFVGDTAEYPAAIDEHVDGWGARHGVHGAKDGLLASLGPDRTGEGNGREQDQGQKGKHPAFKPHVEISSGQPREAA